MLCDACVALCLHRATHQGQSCAGFAFSTLPKLELTRQLFVVTLLVQLGCNGKKTADYTVATNA